ncbi:MAG: class II aldolase/adducin family protein [Lachnospiraceae bacterium]
MRPIIHPAEQICQIMARIYGKNLTTVSGGNLSLKDDEGNIWVSPSGGDKASLKRTDVCRILEDGTTVGNAKPSLEFRIHNGIYARRHDIKAVLHAHSPALVAMSIIRSLPNVRLLPDVFEMTGEAGLAPYALPGSDALVESVGGVFAEGYDVVILENHGIFCGSRIDLYDAYRKFEALEFSVQTEMMAGMLSAETTQLTDSQIAAYTELKNRKYDIIDTAEPTNEEILLRQQICDLSKRAYDKQIFSYANGNFSARTSDGGMIITPEGVDNSCLSEQELVKVCGNRCEKGKVPSRMAYFHSLIYEKCPDICSVVIAAPPYAATFAVTGEPFDVRVIPECFNRLQTCRTFSFDEFINEPEKIAEYLKLNTPIAIVQNGFFIVCSVSPFAAYDRLEIAEYTSKSIHLTKMMGSSIITISDDNIEALKNRFKIPKPEKAHL